MEITDGWVPEGVEGNKAADEEALLNHHVTKYRRLPQIVAGRSRKEVDDFGGTFRREVILQGSVPFHQCNTAISTHLQGASPAERGQGLGRGSSWVFAHSFFVSLFFLTISSTYIVVTRTKTLQSGST
ncbi:hypothetical protein F5890DRAFT_1550204 [Lentinula detonsa]|uniref:Uncharacterized protein n=1 Tax=Lentinula detonsa TaxID=2804962 RepID=A0AA38Q7F9_9AGAR|nr:hypothetical protein F5890DRAFT_1550204 [Lentinula detonsa]